MKPTPLLFALTLLLASLGPRTAPTSRARTIPRPPTTACASSCSPPRRTSFIRSASTSTPGPAARHREPHPLPAAELQGPEVRPHPHARRHRRRRQGRPLHHLLRGHHEDDGHRRPPRRLGLRRHAQRDPSPARHQGRRQGRREDADRLPRHEGGLSAQRAVRAVLRLARATSTSASARTWAPRTS